MRMVDQARLRALTREDDLMSERLKATVLLLFGDEAEITTEHRDHTDPERVPVARLVAETGIPRGELAGAALIAVVSDEGGLERFERA
jgi:hypothetical protein